MELDQDDLQLLPCSICNRKFAPDRLEKHVQVCEKLKNGNRKVFNAYAHRTKGTALEDYLKIHTRSQTPEGRSVRQDHAAKGRNQPQGRLPAGPGEPKEKIKANGNRVTCPHCSRHFAPEPAERHIPKCRLVKSRPPPPRPRP
ncbi:zinc finger C2HC domain-containing protein 1C-like [Genypterus blacodes]|uniref:zinc finger C2HC domain-containing protein 1C-like n=1 Tax=Genypterus blacodes TaxID=154954 RepID=UPI003F777754